MTTLRHPVGLTKIRGPWAVALWLLTCHGAALGQAQSPSLPPSSQPALSTPSTSAGASADILTPCRGLNSDADRDTRARCKTALRAAHQRLTQWVQNTQNRSLTVSVAESLNPSPSQGAGSVTLLDSLAQNLRGLQINELADWTLHTGEPTTAELTQVTTTIDGYFSQTQSIVDAYNRSRRTRNLMGAAGCVGTGAATGAVLSGGATPWAPLVAVVGGFYAGAGVMAAGQDDPLAPADRRGPLLSTPASSPQLSSDEIRRQVDQIFGFGRPVDPSTAGPQSPAQTRPLPSYLYMLSTESPEQYRERMQRLLDQRRSQAEARRQLNIPLTEHQRNQILQQLLFEWHRDGLFPDHRAADWARALLEVQSPEGRHQRPALLRRWDELFTRAQSLTSDPQIPFNTRAQALTQFLEDHVFHLSVDAQGRPNRPLTGVASFAQCLSGQGLSARCITDATIALLEQAAVTLPGEHLAVERLSDGRLIPVLYREEGRRVVRLSRALSTIPERGEIYRSAYLAYQALADRGEHHTVVSEDSLRLLARGDRWDIPNQSDSNTPVFRARPAEALSLAYRQLVEPWNQRQRRGDPTFPVINDENSLVRLELEALVRSNPSAHLPARMQAAWARWLQIRERARRALDQLPSPARGETPTLTALRRIAAVRRVLVDEVTENYVEAEAGILSALEGRGVNCQGNSRLLLALLAELGVAPPPGEQFAYHQLPIHKQLVLYNPQSRTFRNILTSNRPEAYAVGDLYTASLFPASVARTYRVGDSFQYDQFLIQRGREDTPRSGTELARATRAVQQSRRVHNNIDGPGTQSGFSGMPENNPAFARLHDPGAPAEADLEIGATAEEASPRARVHREPGQTRTRQNQAEPAHDRPGRNLALTRGWDPHLVRDDVFVDRLNNSSLLDIVVPPEQMRRLEGFFAAQLREQENLSEAAVRTSQNSLLLHCAERAFDYIPACTTLSLTSGTELAHQQIRKKALANLLWMLWDTDRYRELAYFILPHLSPSLFTDCSAGRLSRVAIVAEIWRAYLSLRPECTPYRNGPLNPPRSASCASVPGVFSYRGLHCPDGIQNITPPPERAPAYLAQWQRIFERRDRELASLPLPLFDAATRSSPTLESEFFDQRFATQAINRLTQEYWSHPERYTVVSEARTPRPRRTPSPIARILPTTAPETLEGGGSAGATRQITMEFEMANPAPNPVHGSSPTGELPSSRVPALQNQGSPSRPEERQERGARLPLTLSLFHRLVRNGRYSNDTHQSMLSAEYMHNATQNILSRNPPHWSPSCPSRPTLEPVERYPLRFCRPYFDALAQRDPRFHGDPREALVDHLFREIQRHLPHGVLDAYRQSDSNLEPMGAFLPQVVENRIRTWVNGMPR